MPCFFKKMGRQQLLHGKINPNLGIEVTLDIEVTLGRVVTLGILLTLVTVVLVRITMQ